MSDPSQTPIYRGQTGLQSKVPAMDRGASCAGNQQSHSRNATPPLGLGMYVRAGRDSAGNADPPLGVGLRSPAASLGDGVGTTTPGTSPDMGTD